MGASGAPGPATTRWARRADRRPIPVPIRRGCIVVDLAGDGELPPSEKVTLQPFQKPAMRSLLVILLHRGMIRCSLSRTAARAKFRAWSRDEEDAYVFHSGALRSIGIDYAELNGRLLVTHDATYAYASAFDLLSRSRTFSVFQMHSGRNRLRLLPEHRGRTAFNTSLGVYEWRVLPYHVRGAGSRFLAAMGALFEENVGRGVCLTASDIIVYADSNDELERLERIVDDKLARAGCVAKVAPSRSPRDKYKPRGVVLAPGAPELDPDRTSCLSRTLKLPDVGLLGTALLKVLSSWMPRSEAVAEAATGLRDALAASGPERGVRDTAKAATAAITRAMERDPIPGRGLLVFYLYVNDEAYGAFLALEAEPDGRSAIWFVARPLWDVQKKLGLKSRHLSVLLDCLHWFRDVIENRAVECRLSQPSLGDLEATVKNDPDALDFDVAVKVVAHQDNVVARMLCESAAYRDAVDRAEADGGGQNEAPEKMSSTELGMVAPASP